MTDHVRVLFVVPTLALGGVERVLGSTLRHLDRTAFDPVVCVLARSRPDVAIPHDIPVVTLTRRGATSFPHLVFQLAGVVRRYRPDVVVAYSGLANFVCLAARLFLRIGPGLTVMEHVAPMQMYTSPVEHRFGRLKRVLIRYLYPRADRIVAVSHGIRDQLIDVFSLNPSRVYVVEQSVEVEHVREQSRADIGAWPEQRPVILSVGRLARQKNHELLLRAVHRLGATCPVSALILGEGPERDRLEAIRADLGLANVAMPGAVDNPYPYMARSDVFVMSSDFEGSPVALIEALAVGAPSIATDCPTGPREILSQGEFGVLVPPGDEVALADAIRSLLGDDRRRDELRRCGPRRAEAFSAARATRELEGHVTSTVRVRT